jgi:glycosyltransferase involved in cell wall biosynthesis
LNPPLVTIVVLCHNYGRFLSEAIDSALAQTYPNVEILVIDDGSTDDSLEVAQRYADRVKVVTQANMGMERTANRGAKEASGDLFCFLSADDVLEPRYVEELAAALAREPEAAYAYCRPRLFGARNGPMRCLPFSAFFMVKRSNFVAGSALCRRSEYLAAGGYAEDLGEHAFEDWDLWLRLLERGRRGTYVREPLLRWRRHETGSRNPEQGAREVAARAFMRERHRELVDRLATPRARAAYAVDVALAALDLLVGFSRWPRAVAVYERSSWRRFRGDAVG